MRKTLLFFSFLACLLVQTGSAALIVREFTLDFFNGPLNGQSFTGSFSYDDTNVPSSGTKILGPDGGSTFPTGLKSFSIEVAGTLFSLADAVSYPDLPGLAFENGIPKGFAYISPNLSGGNLFGSKPTGWSFTGSNKSNAIGSLKPLGVPDGGASAVLLGLSICGIVALRKRLS